MTAATLSRSRAQLDPSVAKRFVFSGYACHSPLASRFENRSFSNNP